MSGDIHQPREGRRRSDAQGGVPAAAQLHVVYGAGPLGRRVAAAASAAGHEVIIASRSGAGPAPARARHVQADASDAVSVRRLCAGASVIYNCAQPPYDRWGDLFPPIQRALILGASATGARLVAAENLYMYGPVDGPMTEDLPYAASTRKGRVRARMAEELLAADRDGLASTVAGRASDFFGADVATSFMGPAVFRRAARGARVMVVGDPDCLHTYTYVEDFARALVTLGTATGVTGRAWHVPSAPTVTTREFIEIIGWLTGEPVRVGRLPSTVVRLGGVFSALAREAAEMIYEFDEPFVVDHSAFSRRFGARVTDHRTAIRETLAGLGLLPGG